MVLESASAIAPGRTRLYQDVAEVFVEHPRFVRTLAEIRLALELGGIGSEAPCLHVSGPPGVGKTTLRRKLAAEYVPERNARRVTIPKYPEMTADYLPLLQLEMPERVTVKSMCKEMLRAMGDPFWYRGDEFGMTDRVDRYLIACGTKGTLIDEAHRAVDRSGVVASEHLLDWFKSRHSKTGVSIIFLGLGRLRYLFETDAQLERRWDAELRLDPYGWMTSDGREDNFGKGSFIGILDAFRELSPLPFDVDVMNEQMALRFFYASRGVIGNVKKLLLYAMKIAALEADSIFKVDLALLSRAFDGAFRPQLHGMENPFKADFQVRLPPAYMDDTSALPAPAVRRKKKSRLQAKQEAEMVLTKG